MSSLSISPTTACSKSDQHVELQFKANGQQVMPQFARYMQSITLPSLSRAQAERLTAVAPLQLYMPTSDSQLLSYQMFPFLTSTGRRQFSLDGRYLRKAIKYDASPLSPSVGKLLVLVPSRMSRRLISLLLSGLITQTSAQHVVKEPDTACVTYLSTYLVPISSHATGSVPTDGANSSLQTFDAVLTASTTLESGISPSLELTEALQPSQSLSGDSNQFITTSVTTGTNTADSDPTTAPGPDDQLVVFRIVPDTDSSRRRRLKRALGGFVGSTSEICQDASAFSLSGGRLLDGRRPIYYNGEDFK
ncbi:Uncharacterized protein HZ326_13317 [Fusarium oxysporum f. sp. albedinis]|nr:Uncharacterized protein HZ326_13317 [Fusarium oxysporum f. sp. albedinis]